MSEHGGPRGPGGANRRAAWQAAFPPERPAVAPPGARSKAPLTGTGRPGAVPIQQAGGRGSDWRAGRSGRGSHKPAWPGRHANAAGRRRRERREAARCRADRSYMRRRRMKLADRRADTGSKSAPSFSRASKRRQAAARAAAEPAARAQVRPRADDNRGGGLAGALGRELHLAAPIEIVGRLAGGGSREIGTPHRRLVSGPPAPDHASRLAPERRAIPVGEPGGRGSEVPGHQIRAGGARGWCRRTCGDLLTRRRRGPRGRRPGPAVIPGLPRAPDKTSASTLQSVSGRRGPWQWGVFFPSPPPRRDASGQTDTNPSHAIRRDTDKVTAPVSMGSTLKGLGAQGEVR